MIEADSEDIYLPKIEESDFDYMVSKQTLGRGLGYFHRNRIKSLAIEQTGERHWTIRSSVLGSANRAYIQEIAIVLPPPKISKESYLEIYMMCSCPVGEDCKHCIAALYAYREHSQNSAKHLLPKDKALLEKEIEERRIEDWIKGLSENWEPEPSLFGQNSVPNLHKAKETVYILRKASDDPDALFPYEVQLEVGLCQRLKNGSLGKFSPIYYHQMLYHNPLGEEASKIVRLLRPMEEHFNGVVSSILRSELAELALERAIQSGLLFWEDTKNPPLKFIEKQTLAFEWVNTQDDKKLLLPRIEGLADTPRIFYLQNCWFVSPASGLIGKLSTPGLSREKIAQLLVAPPLPEKVLQKVSDTFATQLPEKSVPTPVKPQVQIQWIRNKKPTVWLELHQILDHELPGFKTKMSTYFFAIRYKYGDYIVDHDSHKGVAIFQKGNEVVKIELHPGIKQEVEDYFREVGFMEIMDRYHVGGGVVPRQFFSGQTEQLYYWYDFFENQVPELEKRGWEITSHKDFPLEFAEPEEWYADLDEESKTDWFSLGMGVVIDEEQINVLPAIAKLLRELRSPRKDPLEEIKKRKHILVESQKYGRFIKLPVERLLPILQTLVELFDKEPLNKEGKLEFSKHAGMQFANLLDNPNLKWHGADHLKKIQKKLRNFSGIKDVAQPRGFKGKLRDYQKKGLSWMEFLREYEFGGILADDMGLGKTIQALAWLEKARAKGILKKKPALIIAPTSLMGNWQREAALFTPNIRVLLIHGPERHPSYKKIEQSDLIISSYPIVQRDAKKLKEHEFSFVILDESQYIKNATSKTAQAVFGLKAEQRLCLSGTPMENHLGELWSMFHFLMPGFLGPRERFRRIFQNPIEKEADMARFAQLQNRVRPFLLRRSKEDVLQELPPKTEIVRTVLLEGKQRDLYESIRVAMDAKVREAIQSKGLARSHITILDALLKLRQVCCDPALLPLNQGKKVKESAKMELLMDMLPELIAEGRRILLFSQFTTMLGLIEKRLKEMKISYVKLTGQTRKRDIVIDRFQSGEVPLFLISLKAGGVGLNLTAADTVIHYDPWWNPAVERQATDRAHRIGQKKKVFVYKLLTKDTVEERILELQDRKRSLAEGVYGKKQEKKALALENEDLNRLLSPIGEDMEPA